MYDGGIVVVTKTITMPRELADRWEVYKAEVDQANLSKLLSELLMAYLRKDQTDGPGQ